MTHLTPDILAWTYNQARVRTQTEQMCAVYWKEYKKQWTAKHGEYVRQKGVLSISKPIRKRYTFGEYKS